MTKSVSTVVHVLYLSIIAVLTGVLVFTSVQHDHVSTRTTFPVSTPRNNIPYYCSSIQAMEQFQNDHPTLGLYCPNL